jgi:hypothetical protein
MKSEELEQRFLKRSELAARWRCSVETIKRRQRSGALNPIRLSQRLLLYSLKEIEALEKAGATITETLSTEDNATPEPRLVQKGRKLQ